MKTHSLSEIDAEIAYRSLFDFFRLSWTQLEKSQPLVLNWHLEAICDHIQSSLEDWIAYKTWEKAREEALEQRRPFKKPAPKIRMQNQIINVPPGSSKSRIVSVCAPAWMWLRWPSWRAMFLSANPRVAVRDSMFCRQLIESRWYRNSFGPDWKLRDDQNAKSAYWTTEGGMRIASGINAKLIGDRADFLGIDDPHDPEEVKIDKNRQGVNERYDSSIGNRVNDLNVSLRLVIMQRVHQLDLSGHLLKRDFHHLCIPQEFEPFRISEDPDPTKNQIPRVTGIGWSDPREKLGDLMDPVRFPAEALEKEKQTLKSFGYAGQHQQRPAPIEGGIWKRRWWGYWVPSGLELPPHMEQLDNGEFHECAQIVLPARFDMMAQSWDMAFGKSETSAMVVGQVWAVRKVDRFMVDQKREQLDFTESVSAVENLSEQWPEAESKWIENKANGPAIISSLKNEISGIIGIEPEGSKEARAMAEQPTIESGHVWLPHPALFDATIIAKIESSHPQIAAMLRRGLRETAKANSKRKAAQSDNWVTGFVNEAASFPNGAFKDVVDTASQALNQIRKYIRLRDAIDESDNQTSTSWTSSR